MNFFACIHFFRIGQISLRVTDEPTISDDPTLLDHHLQMCASLLHAFFYAISLQLTQRHAAYVSPMTIVHIILHKGIRILAELALQIVEKKCATRLG